MPSGPACSTEGWLEDLAGESGSVIVPSACGNRGDVHGRRRHAIAAGATDAACAIALCALCLIGTQRLRPGPVPPAPARQCEKEHLADCLDITGTAGTGRAVAAWQVSWSRRYHGVRGNLHMHVYFYMISYLLYASCSYPFLDCAFYRHTRYKHDTGSIQHMHRYDTYDTN